MLCRKHLHDGSAELQIPRPSASVRDDKAPNDTGRGGRRFSAAPTAPGSSSTLISQPFRAGLTFGGRPLDKLRAGSLGLASMAIAVSFISQLATGKSAPRNDEG